MTIDLCQTPKTLIVGKSGSGKSVLIDAICYALFGKPYRNINIPMLVNSYSNKAMLVELEFEIGKKNYMVRRGAKPNVFEIFEEGTLIAQDSLSRDYQSFFENTILKFNLKSFRQIIVLGTATYVPFMELKAAERRTVIEDLLDLQVFSSMNVILSDRIKSNKELLTVIEQDIRLYESNLDLHTTHLKEVQEDIAARKQALELKIITHEGDIKSTNELIGKLKEKDAYYQQVKEHIDRKWMKKRDDFNTFIVKATNKVKKLQKEIDFYEHTDKCPTCSQSIEHSFKVYHNATAKERIDTFKAQIEDAKAMLVKIAKEYEAYEEAEDQQKQIKLNMNELMISRHSAEALLKNDQRALADLDKTFEAVDTSRKEEYERKLAAANAERAKILEHREVLSIASTLLKDGGIKTLIIKQYIPIMNKIINQYLGQMNLFVDFNLDENFEEVIRAPYREDNSYFSFSEGEKKRINLAIMFAWRAIARLRNTANSNLLIFDEILDSALDSDGRDDFMNIIEAMEDTNIFIISHNTDNLGDKFDRTLVFHKIKNFSHMRVA